MTTLLNSFEGGTSGTTISTGNSGGASGSAFDVVTIGGTSAVAYSNAQAAHGALSGKFTVASGVSNISSIAWSTSMGTQTQIWYRMYLYFTSAPASFGLWRALQGASLCAGIVLVTDGTIQGRSSSNATVFTTASSYPLNQWFRLEGFVTGSASVGQMQLKLFGSPNGTIPTETQTTAANLNTLGSPNTYQYGVLTSDAATFWMDDLGLSSAGYIGPVKTPGGTSRTTIVPSLVAAGAI